jgi:hypothetical protein
MPSVPIRFQPRAYPKFRRSSTQIETEKIYFGLMGGGSFGSQSTDTGVSESWPNACAAGAHFVDLSVQKDCQTASLVMGETPKVCGGFADKS